MISVNNCNFYKNLKLGNSHAYLFYSQDEVLNNEVALNYAKSIICDNGIGCTTCSACKQFNSSAHPDVTILKQASIKVDDITQLISKTFTKPIAGNKKVFVVLNADTINEISQNKLLKSLEEPNENTIFILTTTKLDKLLPTILSRLNKVYIPKLGAADKQIVVSEYAKQDVDISAYLDTDCTLSEIINFTTNQSHIDTINSIFNLFANLNTTADIPKVVSSLKDYDKSLFFGCMQDIFLSCLKNSNKYKDIDIIKNNYSNKAITKIVPLIEQAYIKQMSNVNIIYLLDNLLFNILKERFLCK